MVKRLCKICRREEVMKGRRVCRKCWNKQQRKRMRLKRNSKPIWKYRDEYKDGEL